MKTIKKVQEFLKDIWSNFLNAIEFFINDKDIFDNDL